jgi:NADH-quinone oxidoreductase subunit L
MKVTFVTFAFGYLAILGVPPFAGFFSKDRIIEVAFAHNTIVGLAALLGAGITAFYMTRLMMMTFFGEKRWEKDVHPHESPAFMTIPLVVLAALSVLGGVMILGSWIQDWLGPVVGEEEHHEPPIPALAITGLAVLVVAIGVAVAIMLVGRREIPRVAPQDVSFVTRAARADVYGNAINDELVVKPGKGLTRGLVTLDRTVIDGLFSGGALTISGIGALARRAQNGFVRSYALSLLGGVLLVVLALLAVNLA